MSAVCVSVWYYYSYYHYTASTKHAGSLGCIFVSVGVTSWVIGWYSKITPLAPFSVSSGVTNPGYR